MTVLRQVVEHLLPQRAVDRLRQWQGKRKGNQSYDDFTERRRVMRRVFSALRFNGITGDYAEFGCWGGVTFTLAYDAIHNARVAPPIPRHLWAFDSFQGLPATTAAADEHPVWNPGTLAMSLDSFRDVVRSRGVPESAYTAVPGFYEDTIGPSAQYTGALPHDIAFAYIDCDLYSSTKTVLEFLTPRLKHGMVLAFDDYYCFSRNTMAGERKALLELMNPDLPFQFCPYIQFGWFGMSFVVEDRRLIERSAAELGMHQDRQRSLSHGASR